MRIRLASDRDLPVSASRLKVCATSAPLCFKDLEEISEGHEAAVFPKTMKVCMVRHYVL